MGKKKIAILAAGLLLAAIIGAFRVSGGKNDEPFGSEFGKRMENPDLLRADFSKENAYSYPDFVAFLVDKGFADVEIERIAGEVETDENMRYLVAGTRSFEVEEGGKGYTLEVIFFLKLEYSPYGKMPVRIAVVSCPYVRVREGGKRNFSGEITYGIAPDGGLSYELNGEITKKGDIKAEGGEAASAGEEGQITYTSDGKAVCEVSFSSKYFLPGSVKSDDFDAN